MPCTSLPAATLRRALAAYLAVVALITAIYAIESARALHAWILAEWLISYTAGPIRRGLLGQLLLLSHLPLIPAALTLQLAIYALFYLATYRLTAHVRWSWPLVAALVSPATLAFTVLDPPSSVRKEALLYTALALSLLLLRHRPRVALALLTLAAPVLVLTHEALLAFVPYLFAAPLLLHTWSPRALLPAAGLTLAAAALVFTHPGTPAQASTICASLATDLHRPMSLTQPQSLCGGAIAYLARTPAAARDDTRRAASVYSYPTRYAIPAVLALAPAGFLLWQRRRRPGTRVVFLAAALSVAASAPLFLLARDWGRWISLHATCLLLLLLALEHLPSRSQPTPSDEGLPIPRDPVRRLAAFATLFLYATAWTLPAVGIFPGRFGYLDLLRYVSHYSARNAAPHPPGQF